MPDKIILAYKTMLVPGFKPDESLITVPGNYKNADTIAAYKAEQLAAMSTAAMNQPFTGTFAEVQLACPSRKLAIRFVHRLEDTSRQSLVTAMRAWLLKEFPGAWPHTTHASYPDGRPPVIFIGFAPRLFLKIFGLECAMPVNNPNNDAANVLPLSMWYTNTDHRDIGEAVMPNDCSKFLNWATVLKAFNLDAHYKAWKGPGNDPTQDLSLATALAAQLGMLNETDRK